jgi:hypothetical protein
MHASIGFLAMGILDDAIREHLDLRRKHGAPEEELQRQEEEALGPARREVASPQAQDTNGAGEPAAEEASAMQAAVPAEADAAGAAAPESPTEAPTEAPSASSREPEAAVDAPVETPREESPPAEAATQEPQEPIVVTERPAPEKTSFDTLEPEPPGAEPEPGPAVEALEPKSDTPADGFEALESDDFVGDEEQPAGDDADVLEDTPDFLQETPEHDRLWFEQKPPRDFDFD